MMFTDDELKTIYRVLQSTWNEIGHDCLAATEAAGEGDTMDRDTVIEVVLDANYADHHVRRADAELWKRFKALSYEDQKKIAKGTFKYSHYCM